jgi:uncharacterized protein with HEPN domain
MKSIKILLEDMLNAINAVESYHVATYDEFFHDSMLQDAMMFNLIILGEAANKIPKDFQDTHLELPWASIIGTRNVIVHGYDQIKLKIVWDIITKDLGQLKATIKELLAKIN